MSACSVKNKKTHYACKIHIACEIFFVIQMAFHIILPSSFKKPCRMWLQKMTSIQSKCLFSQVAEMHTPFEAVRFWQTKSKLKLATCVATCDCVRHLHQTTVCCLTLADCLAHFISGDNRERNMGFYPVPSLLSLATSKTSSKRPTKGSSDLKFLEQKIQADSM